MNINYIEVLNELSTIGEIAYYLSSLMVSIGIVYLLTEIDQFDLIPMEAIMVLNAFFMYFLALRSFNLGFISIIAKHINSFIDKELVAVILSIYSIPILVTILMSASIALFSVICSKISFKYNS